MARTIGFFVPDKTLTGVFLVEIDADALSGATTLYYASRSYTLDLDPSGTQDYTDALAPEGIQMDWSRLRAKGGIASRGGFRLVFRNEEALSSTLLSSYYLVNDEVRVYYIEVTGTEDENDKTEINRGVVDRISFELHTFTLHCKDDALTQFREIPNERIDNVRFPNAPKANLGKVWPQPFGVINSDENNTDNEPVFLSPMRLVDISQQVYLAGISFNSFGDAHQWYDTAKRYARCVSQTNQTVYGFDGSNLVPCYCVLVQDPERKLLLKPNRKKGGYSVGADASGFDWRAVTDNYVSTTLLVDSGDALYLYFEGCPKIGSFLDLLVFGDSSTASKTFDYEVFVNTTSIDSASGITDLISTLLTTTEYANWEDNWNFEIVNIEIDGTQDGNTFWRVLAELRFDDQQSHFGNAPLELFVGVQGWGEGAYTDGGNIIDGVTVLESPPHILEAIWRGQPLLGISENSMDTTSWDDAHTARSSWKMAFCLDTAVDPVNWINEYCFQTGLHLFQRFDNTWRIIARDKDADPDHIFLWNEHIAVKNDRNPDINQWDLDCTITKTPVTEVVNEAGFRYRLDRGSKQYTAIKARSGRVYTSGTCSTSSSTKKLVDGSATFQSAGVQVGMTVEVEDDQDYTIAAVDSQTQLELSGTVSDNSSGTNYWLGPNLDGPWRRSQAKYKTENHLRRPLTAYQDVGGYTSDIIADDATADLFLDYIEEWFTETWLQAEFQSFMGGIAVELGDLCFFDHPQLPTSKRPTTISAVDEAIDDSETVWDVDAGTGSSYVTNDFYLIDNEVVKKTAHTANTITVTRAQLNSVAATHANGTDIKHLTVKWEVIGYRGPSLRVDVRSPERSPYPYTGIKIQEVPQ